VCPLCRASVVTARTSMPAARPRTRPQLAPALPAPVVATSSDARSPRQPRAVGAAIVAAASHPSPSTPVTGQVVLTHGGSSGSASVPRVRSTPAASSTSSITSAITAGLNRMTFNRLLQRRDGALSPPNTLSFRLSQLDANGTTSGFPSRLTQGLCVAGCAQNIVDCAARAVAPHPTSPHLRTSPTPPPRNGFRRN
jgi:hypothetical protein